jgi:hypothetical protein
VYEFSDVQVVRVDHTFLTKGDGGKKKEKTNTNKTERTKTATEKGNKKNNTLGIVYFPCLFGIPLFSFLNAVKEGEGFLVFKPLVRLGRIVC